MRTTSSFKIGWSKGSESSFIKPEIYWQKQVVGSDAVSEPVALTLVSPWFDHTPFVPMLMGGVSLFLGYHFPSIPPALFYRLPMLAVAGLSLVLVFLIAKKLFGYWPAIVSLILVSFSPAFIFGQRLVLPENFIGLFLLAGIYFYLQKQPLLYLILLTILAGLVKPTGLLLLAVLVVALARERRFKDILWLTGISLGVVVLVYGAYGLSIDMSAFLDALKSQSYRLLGWSNPSWLFSSPGFTHESLQDFSYHVLLFLGLGMFLLPQKNEHGHVIATAILLSFITIWATSAEDSQLGWYRIPLFLLLAVGSASMMRQEFLYLVALLLGLTVISNLGLVRYPTHPLPESLLLRSVIGLLSLFFIISSVVWVRIKKYPVFVLAGLLIVYMGYSAYFVHTYFGARCMHMTCATPLITVRSVVNALLQ